MIRSEAEDYVDLSMDGDFSAFLPHSSAANDFAAMRQLRLLSKSTVELGKPTMLISMDDAGDRTYQVEVTATRIKDE